eukprot:265089-Chlamydomonas_euryale.AAC.2
MIAWYTIRCCAIPKCTVGFYPCRSTAFDAVPYCACLILYRTIASGSFGLVGCGGRRLELQGEEDGEEGGVLEGKERRGRQHAEGHSGARHLASIVMSSVKASAISRGQLCGYAAVVPRPWCTWAVHRDRPGEALCRRAA